MKIKYLLILILVFGISISAHFLFAWEEPIGDPAPNNNANPPIYNSGDETLPIVDAGNGLTILGDVTIEGETRLGNYDSLPVCDPAVNLGSTVFLTGSGSSQDQMYTCTKNLPNETGIWRSVKGETLCADCEGRECGENEYGVNCGTCSSPEICSEGICVDFTDHIGGSWEYDGVITTCEELQNIIPYNNYILGNDIDCSMTNPSDPNFDPSGPWANGKGWIPINTEGFYCGPTNSGIFDGNNHVIDGLYINEPYSQCAGLFGEVNEVFDLGLTNVDITAHFAGGIATKARKITNSYVTGKIYVSSGAGGLVYQPDSNGSLYITDSYADVDITGGSNVGGLIGYHYSPLLSSSNRAILRSYATGDVSSGGDNIGGLVGYAKNSRIDYSYATGNVTGGSNVGGFVGYNMGYIERCYATGDVNGNIAGGFVGYDDYDVGPPAIGGRIEYSYSTGAVSGTSIGGFCGSGDGCIDQYVITKSYWDVTTSGQTNCSKWNTQCNGGVTGLTNTEMKQESSFPYFVFYDAGNDNGWKLYEIRPSGEYYPCLSWQENNTCPVAN